LSMDASKIHNHLKLFISDPFPPYEKSLNELTLYLDDLVTNGRVVCEMGVYKVKL
jgi:hypothetical protein